MVVATSDVDCTQIEQYSIIWYKSIELQQTVSEVLNSAATPHITERCSQL